MPSMGKCYISNDTRYCYGKNKRVETGLKAEGERGGEVERYLATFPDGIRK